MYMLYWKILISKKYRIKLLESIGCTFFKKITEFVVIYKNVVFFSKINCKSLGIGPDDYCNLKIVIIENEICIKIIFC